MVLAGVLRIELRHYDLESHALTVTLHPNIRQDACTSIEGANQNSSDYICKYFAVCVFWNGSRRITTLDLAPVVWSRTNASWVRARRTTVTLHRHLLFSFSVYIIQYFF